MLPVVLLIFLLRSCLMFISGTVYIDWSDSTEIQSFLVLCEQERARWAAWTSACNLDTTPDIPICLVTGVRACYRDGKKDVCGSRAGSGFS